MRRFGKRSISLFLVLILCISSCSTLIVAATEPAQVVTPTASQEVTLGEGDTRFVFDTLVSEKGTVYETATTPTKLSLSPDEHVFASADVSLLETSSNALYVSLVNETGATALHITYTYVQNALTKSETLTQAIEANSGKAQAFLLRADHLSADVSKIELSFAPDTATTGRVTLNAFFNLSAYFNDANDVINVTRCHYDPTAKTVEIKGELDYDTTVFYAGQTLALFALSVREDLHLSNKTPIARTGVSFSFSFTVDASSSDEIFSRYVVAAVNDKGEVIPLCAPLYPTLDVAEQSSETGFKGFHGASLATTIDCDPDVEIVDVYLDRLFQGQSDGILYAGEHAYYYFDAAYVSELDRYVRNLTGMGTHVYLRFLIGKTANDLTFADYAGTDTGVVNKLPVIRSEQSQYDLYAVVNFLTSRYATADIGKISGVVLGREADRASIYSYTAAESMADYVSLYAATFNLIAVTTKCNLPNARVILPVSDRTFAGYATAGQMEGDYYATFFLPSLLTVLSAKSLSPQSFTLMLTSESSPALVAPTDGKTYGVDNLSQFLSEWADMATVMPFAARRIFFAWQPKSGTARELTASYVAHYLALHAETSVTTFITDTTLGEEGVTEALAYLARYINTDKFDEVALGALSVLGGTVSELFPAIDLSRVTAHSIHRKDLTNGGFAGAVVPLGSYTAWDFTTATGTLGWYGGVDCRDVTMHSESKGGRSLTALMSGMGEYADLAYHFPTATDLSFAPMISMDLAVAGAANARYEIQLRLCGASDTVIASSIVMTGQKQTLCLDLTDTAAALSDLNALRIVARPLDGACESFTLCLFSISLGSMKLDDTALAERVEALMQGTGLDETQKPEKREWTVPLLLTALVVLVSAAVIVLVLTRKKHRIITKK